jgi:hypothetical protein
MTQTYIFRNVGAVLQFLENVALKLYLFALLVLAFCLNRHRSIVLAVDREVYCAEGPLPDLAYYVKSALDYKITKSFFCDSLFRHLIYYYYAM